MSARGVRGTIHLMDRETPWHALPLGALLAQVDAKQDGLTGAEARRRLDGIGTNALTEQRRAHPLWLFARQLAHPLIVLLIVAGVVTLFLSAWLDGAVIFIVVLLNAGIGFYQERKAQKALNALHAQERSMALVLRDGRWQRVPTPTLVPGDTIQLRAGDNVPADARVVRALHVAVSEALLTGEAEPITKSVAVLPKETDLPDRANMVWMGTAVVDGKAEAVVVSTGDRTQFGHIGELTQRTRETQTPFERRVARLGRFLGILTLIVAAALFVAGILVGRPAGEMFLLTVAVTVSAIPEGLPVAMVAILTIGMVRVLHNGGLVKTLAAAQALGSTNVILTDKTGTLTEGRMRVAKVLAALKRDGILELAEEEERIEDVQLRALAIAASTADVVVENPEDAYDEWRMRGNSSDQAFFIAAAQAGLDPLTLEEQRPVFSTLPFSSNRKYAASIRAASAGAQLCISGAPEVVLRYSSSGEIGGRVVPLSADDRNELRVAMEKLAAQGLRLIAVASRQVDEQDATGDPELVRWEALMEELVFVGVIALRDPVREDVPHTVAQTHAAGIRTVIVTGDHAQTAIAVGKEIGLLPQKRHAFTVMEGHDVHALSEEELAREVRTVDIFSRVTPEHKLRITRAWQSHGNVVATLGDGVNDAPALKLADVGVAVGSGTDLAKEASDIILLNNSFTTVVAAVREGRVIIDNIKKVITYLLSDSFTEILLISFAVLAGLPLPILPAQILWAKVIADVGPGIALAFEKGEQDVMKMPPVSQTTSIIDKEMRFLIIVVGLLTDVILVGLFVFFLGQEVTLEKVRTIIFAALALGTIFYAFSMRSLRRPLWQMNPFSNTYLLWAAALGVCLTLLAVYVPPFSTLLRTVPLTGIEWIIIVGFGMVNVIAIEVGKWLYWRKKSV